MKSIEYNIVDQNGFIIQHTLIDGIYKVTNIFKRGYRYSSSIFKDLFIEVDGIWGSNFNYWVLTTVGIYEYLIDELYEIMTKAYYILIKSLPLNDVISKISLKDGLDNVLQDEMIKEIKITTFNKYDIKEMLNKYWLIVALIKWEYKGLKLKNKMPNDNWKNSNIVEDLMIRYSEEYVSCKYENDEKVEIIPNPYFKNLFIEL